MRESKNIIGRLAVNAHTAPPDNKHRFRTTTRTTTAATTGEERPTVGSKNAYAIRASHLRQPRTPGVLTHLDCRQAAPRRDLNARPAAMTSVQHHANKTAARKRHQQSRTQRRPPGCRSHTPGRPQTRLKPRRDGGSSPPLSIRCCGTRAQPCGPDSSRPHGGRRAARGRRGAVLPDPRRQLAGPRSHGGRQATGGGGRPVMPDPGREQPRASVSASRPPAARQPVSQ